MAATIGLIAAMEMEARPLLRLHGPWERYPLHGYRAHRRTIAGSDCVLVESGMGMEKAAAAARALLSAAEPLFLISFGIAGAVEKEVRIGDVIAAARVFLFHAGRLSEGMKLASLSGPARQAAEQALGTLGARLYTGTAITTRGEQPAMRQLRGCAHPMLEMETMGIARAAGEHATPLLSLRSMSDTPDEPIPMAMDELMDAELKPRFVNIARICMRHPSTVHGLLRFGRNGKKAAEKAVAAVAAILESGYRPSAT